MTIRTILLCLTSTESAPDLINAAAILARRDNAHVIGLFVTESLVVYPAVAMHVPQVAYQDFLVSQRAYATEVKAIFDDMTQAEDFACEWRQISTESGYVADSFINAARSADLVLIAQDDHSEERPAVSNLHERVIRESGRPVLVVPAGYAGTSLGQTVLAGWSETREATRAIHDLLGIASMDALIRILRVGATPADTLADFPANDIAAALSRHGPKIEIEHRPNKGHGVGNVLNAEAFEMGADMIATGAFGHSRAYDFVIGAATRALLRDARLPVLFSK